MIYIFILFVIVSLIGINFKNIKTIDKEALSHERTTMINGFFVGLILFSHFNSYITSNLKIDTIYYFIFNQISQLMVTTFLFYSGYGIYESIKNKKNYMDSFLKKRILKLFVSYTLALCLYLGLNLIIGKVYDIKTILLSLTGWESIGNSNWFIFAIFCLYFSTLLSFKIFKKDNKAGLLLNLIFSFLYIIIIMKFKGSWWYNTILCYNAGMFFSFYKEKIIFQLKNNIYYILTFIILIILGILAYLNNSGYFTYEIISILFTLIVVLITLRIRLGNKILLWLGKNTFNIYILQRLSYIFYDYIGVKNYNIYLYFGISIITVIIMTVIFDKLLKKMHNILGLS